MIATMAERKDEVMNQLHFYNSIWLHSTVGEMSSIKFEEQWHAASCITDYFRDT
jgi:hypothetical protein